MACTITCRFNGIIAGLGLLGGADAAFAQTQFLIADRTSDTLWRVRDLNNDGVISDPGEIFAWFSGANLAGTVAPLNFTALGISKCRIALAGDQGLGVVFIAHDDNNDGDALDAGESKVFAGPGNVAGISLAFPTGVGFDSQCRGYIVNAGNAFGNDAIYQLVDLNGDGDAMDNVDGVNEINPFVADGPSGFGPGNGPYGPQEVFFDSNDVGYVRNSSTGIFAIYRFADANNNYRADDLGELALFFGAGNLSGITVASGFALEPDRAWQGRGAAMYTLQTAPGSLDQLVHIVDANNDLDGQDAGEAAIVFSIATTFTGVDVVSLVNGDVLVTDNSGITVIRLHDNDNDGDFLDAGESTLMIAGPGTLTQARQMDALCRIGDVNCNGVVDIDDLVLVITNWSATGACNMKPDVNCSGTVNIDDLVLVITNWG